MLQRGSQGEAVGRLQRALNVALDRRPPLIPDGDFGGVTEAAVMEFCHRMSMPITGAVSDTLAEVVFTAARQRGWQEAPGAGTPLWLRMARGEVGQQEQPGAPANPAILGYIATFPYLQQVLDHGVPMSATDETAWCACFVQWCLIRAGQRGGPSARAESWRDYGTALEAPRDGAVTVIFSPPRAASASGWHVGFWAGGTAEAPRLLGGNQGNAVVEKLMPGTVRAWRWPN